MGFKSASIESRRCAQGWDSDATEWFACSPYFLLPRDFRLLSHHSFAEMHIKSFQMYIFWFITFTMMVALQHIYKKLVFNPWFSMLGFWSWLCLFSTSQEMFLVAEIVQIVVPATAITKKLIDSGAWQRRSGLAYINKSKTQLSHSIRC